MRRNRRPADVGSKVGSGRHPFGHSGDWWEFQPNAYLVGGLEHVYVSIYWEFHHPNWLSYFFRGVQTTNQRWFNQPQQWRCGFKQPKTGGLKKNEWTRCLCLGGAHSAHEQPGGCHTCRTLPLIFSGSWVPGSRISSTFYQVRIKNESAVSLGRWWGDMKNSAGPGWIHDMSTGWWFGTFGLFVHSVGNFIIPTDEVICFRGVGQPPTT